MARRDAFFERAMDLLNLQTKDLDTAARLEHIERVLKILGAAEHHGSFAVKAPSAGESEKDFLHFIGLIRHNVESAQAMTQHQSHFEREEGFLCQFLKSAPDECILPAMHYRRRADDIAEGLWHLLQLAHGPYRALQQTAYAALSEGERARYDKARRSALEEMEEVSAA